MSKYSKLLKQVKAIEAEPKIPGLTIMYEDDNGNLVGENYCGNQPLPVNVKRVLPVNDDS